ncbi:hypothetical protein FQR65_LT20492 [Abscondita terminalis]|nr:hypothetical protein FQR65_LT20492 [Abscondita terminalis]
MPFPSSAKVSAYSEPEAPRLGHIRARTLSIMPSSVIARFSGQEPEACLETRRDLIRHPPAGHAPDCPAGLNASRLRHRLSAWLLAGLLFGALLGRQQNARAREAAWLEIPLPESALRPRRGSCARYRPASRYLAAVARPESFRSWIPPSKSSRVYAHSASHKISPCPPGPRLEEHAVILANKEFRRMRARPGGGGGVRRVRASSGHWAWMPDAEASLVADVFPAAAAAWNGPSNGRTEFLAPLDSSSALVAPPSFFCSGLIAEASLDRPPGRLRGHARLAQATSRRAVAKEARGSMVRVWSCATFLDVLAALSRCGYRHEHECDSRGCCSNADAGRRDGRPGLGLRCATSPGEHFLEAGRSWPGLRRGRLRETRIGNSSNPAGRCGIASRSLQFDPSQRRSPCSRHFPLTLEAVVVDIMRWIVLSALAILRYCHVAVSCRKKEPWNAAALRGAQRLALRRYLRARSDELKQHVLQRAQAYRTCPGNRGGRDGGALGGELQVFPGFHRAKWEPASWHLAHTAMPRAGGNCVMVSILAGSGRCEGKRFGIRSGRGFIRYRRRDLDFHSMGGPTRFFNGLRQVATSLHRELRRAGSRFPGGVIQPSERAGRGELLASAGRCRGQDAHRLIGVFATMT